MLTDATLRRRYGITLVQYQAMHAAQGGRCAICERKPRASQPDLAVDHDHLTGQVRGLLCSRCNHDLLGCFGEDAMTYLRAYEYLNVHPAEGTIGHHYVPGSVGAEEGPPCS
jgi:hypothetical protein